AAKIAGPVTAVVFGGIMTIITTIVSGALNPTLRNLDLSKETKGN
ncbi:MAG: MFS transporter, partial [Polaribacter sp.]|nr:MFS transporter [Polaribacter sp.]